MTDQDFDTALIASAFDIAAHAGWPAVTVAAAAQAAGLDLARARARAADPAHLLCRFGQLADSHALTGALESGAARERLFDLLMRRIDFLQTHRAGMLALLRGLPADPATALLLASATGRSMGWLAAAAGIHTGRLRRLLITQGLVAVWLYTIRAWERDESTDLSPTMAALDRALARAEQAAGWLNRADDTAQSGPKPFPEPPAALAANTPDPPPPAPDDATP